MNASTALITASAIKTVAQRCRRNVEALSTRSALIALAAGIWGLVPRIAEAQALYDEGKHFVYIVCRSPLSGDPIRGAGVVIANNGSIEVLTADHLAPADKGYVCKGSLGIGDVEPTRVMEEGLRLSAFGYDAMILRLALRPGERDIVPTGYIRLSADLKDKTIRAFGVLGNKPGPIISDPGEIKTTTPVRAATSKGVIYHNARTTEGMSGGPIILDKTRGLIGIVLGGRSDVTGLPAPYAMLAVQDLVPHLSVFGPKELPSNMPLPSASSTEPCHDTLPSYTYPYGDRDHDVGTVTCSRGMTPGQQFAVKFVIERFCTNSEGHAPQAKFQLITNNPEIREQPVIASRRCNREAIVLEHTGTVDARRVASATLRLKGCLTIPRPQGQVRCVLERGQYWIWPKRDW